MREDNHQNISKKEQRRRQMQDSDSGWHIDDGYGGDDYRGRRGGADDGYDRRRSGGDDYRGRRGGADDGYDRRRSGGDDYRGRRAGADDYSRRRGADDDYDRRDRVDDYSGRRGGRDDYRQSVQQSSQRRGGQQGSKNAQRRDVQDDYQRKPRKKSKRKHTIGKVLAVLQAILSVAVLGALFVLDVLPFSYLMILALVLVLLWVFTFFSQFTRRSHVPGKVLAVIMCIVLGVGSYYLLITMNVLSTITNVVYTVDNMVVVVMADDPAQTLQDAAGYTFGIQNGFDTENMDHTISEINTDLSTTIATQGFDTMQMLVQALYDRQVGAIIYNEGFKGTVEEYFPEFAIQTRTLENVEIRTKTELSDNNTSDADVTEEPFMVYISGNDNYGDVSISGRSDVNMLVAVHPKTRQILMISTPRDYYVEFPGVTGGSKDKLTHAGNYGVECSMNALEGIYGCQIDYYVRVNFSSLINIVDALGGVTVNSDYAFTTIYGNSFVQGENYVNGEEALTFVRERQNLPGGDFQRGRNQQLMLTAMINKAMSPAILTGYAGIMASVQDSFATSMGQDMITDLIKMQLREGGSWNIVTLNAAGTPSMEYCYSTSSPLSVVLPDQESIESIKAMIQQLYSGAVLVQPEINIGTP